MNSIFVQGEFRSYSDVNIKEARSDILKSYQFAKMTTTVFISHKHDELEDLKGVLGFLEKTYFVKVYIDSRDTTMPDVTSAETAIQLKNRIESCNKFIFLATNGAINSKWCNWELGYGDSKKYQKNIALFPMKPTGVSYLGNEYMDIYPSIAYYDGTEKNQNGSYVSKGFYVKFKNQITPLAEWFSNT